MKISNPFPSISVFLPEDVLENHDDKVSSYWRKYDSCLLQITGVLTEQPEIQASATQRLSERILIQGTWRPFDLPRKPEGCEAAAATMVNDQGSCWVHAYFVWPSLEIHATVSRQGPLEGCEWAWDTLASIRRGEPNASHFRDVLKYLD
jgi:hypothetical protein